MAKKWKETVTIIEQKQIADGIFSLWLQTENIGKEAVPGQFVNLYSKDKSRLVPRPISICEIDDIQKRLRVVYRVVGKGTEEISQYTAGNTLEIEGPLGNGFPIKNGKKVFLIGGGIGIPPMLELAKQLEGEKQIIVGYRSETFLKEDLEKYGKVFIATEDGSVGVKGNVLDCIKENGLEADIIFACGPTPMLRAIKEYAQKMKIEAWISLEERMACGIGACLACVCQSKDVDEHTNVKNKRICKDGPVFLAEEVEL